MRNLLNPKWLLLTGTLPVVILFLLYSAEYNIIQSLLKPETLFIWEEFAIALAIFGILNLAYTVTAIIKKWKISFFYCIVLIVYAVVFLYLYYAAVDLIIPRTIPSWMVSANMELYMITFLMPGIVHALIVTVINTTHQKKSYNPWASFGIAYAITFSVPFFWYLLAQLVLPLFKTIDKGFVLHAVLIFAVFITLLFLFFLIRGIYILVLKRSQQWTRHQLIWKIIFTLVFPLMGLFLNSIPTLQDPNHDNGLIANFSSIWFFILAFVNGILLCLPKSGNGIPRLALFFAKSITFSFTLYFFVVFLPFLPLSILSILALGLGLLLLAPLVLFIVHAKDLFDDFAFLAKQFSAYKITIVALGGVLLIPFVITVTNFYHKRVLNKALEYVYAPDYSKHYDIDRASIANTLSVISSQKDGNRDLISGSHTPYLSSYFNWIVLDNLTLPDKKINEIRAIFLGGQQGYTSRRLQPEVTETEVKISSAKTTTHYDAEQQSWRTMVDFEIENYSESKWNQEFSTTFELPAGCWISDYYLYVGNKKESGLLMEKKAAQWVFNQIVNENKDPGILYYQNDKEIAFKAFPFTAHEIRRTGIEFIHKEPVTITIDGKDIRLGDDKTAVFAEPLKANAKVVYVSAAAKSRLQRVERSPYYCFIVDLSKDKQKLKPRYTAQIEQLLQSGPVPASGAQICFTNTYPDLKDVGNNWSNQLDSLPCEGGFYLDRAIRKVLFENYTKRENRYPVPIVLTDNLEQAVIGNDLSGFRAAFPESDLFYTIGSNGGLQAHSLIEHPVTVLETVAFESVHTVLAYPDANHPVAYLADNGKADIVLREPVFDVQADNSIKQWNTGLELQGQSLSQLLYPDKAGANWVSAVRQSFRSKIMTPQTAYIVVENEAQKAMLLKKQQQVLSGNKSLELDEDGAERMSEPNLLLLLALLGASLLFKKHRSRLSYYFTK